MDIFPVRDQIRMSSLIIVRNLVQGLHRLRVVPVLSVNIVLGEQIHRLQIFVLIRNGLHQRGDCLIVLILQRLVDLRPQLLVILAARSRGLGGRLGLRLRRNGWRRRRFRRRRGGNRRRDRRGGSRRSIAGVRRRRRYSGRGRTGRLPRSDCSAPAACDGKEKNENCHAL
ncbi:hypothetical protein D3C73_1027100 [compost metagenome]